MKISISGPERGHHLRTKYFLDFFSVFREIRQNRMLVPPQKENPVSNPNFKNIDCKMNCQFRGYERMRENKVGNVNGIFLCNF